MLAYCAPRIPCTLRPLTTRYSSYLVNTIYKPVYITTPIFYPNAAPHLGHLYSLVIADIYARWRHLRNKSIPVDLLIGTDEHGFKIQKAAQAAKKEPLDFCTEKSREFKRLAMTACISSTLFLRTTDLSHKHAVIHLWKDLFRRGFIYKGTHSGWYSVSDECFYPDNQVGLGKDPKTGEEVMVAYETGNPVSHREEDNYIFALSKFREPLLEHYLANPTAIRPLSQYQVVLDTLRSEDGLKDLSISRPASRLQWGIPVPRDPTQTIYVWLDALTVYLTGAGYPWMRKVMRSGEVEWPADLQVIGKDILKFHAIHFPAFLMALELPLPKTLLSHSHWTVEKKKMSKSIGNVIDPFKVMKEYGVDTVRWYLTRVGGRFKDDADWSQVQLEKHESEITNLLGNLLLRVASKRLMERFKDYPINRVDILSAEMGQSSAVQALRALFKELSARVDRHLEVYELAEALDEIVDALLLINKLFTEAAPWKTDIKEAAQFLTWARESLRICAILLQPIVPQTANTLLSALRVPFDQRDWSMAAVGRGHPDLPAVQTVVLFPSREEE